MSLARPHSMFLALSTTLLAAAIGCGSAAEVPAPGKGSPTDAGGGTDSGSKPSEQVAADPVADPVPAELPALVARALDADVAPDLSCAGQPLPTAKGTPTDREFHLVALGGDDSDRVGGLPIELFYNNDPSKTPDVRATSKKADGDKDKNLGTFNAPTPSGFLAFHIPKAVGSYETTALDFDTRVDGPLLATVATDDKVNALSLLIGGATWKATPGLARIVVRAVDCAGRPLAGAHVALQVDGVVSAVTTVQNDPGVRRSYFSQVVVAQRRRSLPQRPGGQDREGRRAWQGRCSGDGCRHRDTRGPFPRRRHSHREDHALFHQPGEVSGAGARCSGGGRRGVRTRSRTPAHFSGRWPRLRVNGAWVIGNCPLDDHAVASPTLGARIPVDGPRVRARLWLLDPA